MNMRNYPRTSISPARRRRRAVPKAGAVAALLTILAAWPLAGFADDFINLRFYPGEEPARENRPSRQAPVTLSFVGKTYEPPMTITDEVRLAPDEAFIRRVEQVNREGDKEAVAALWDPKERAEIAADLEDPAMFSRNRMSYESIEQSALVLKIQYGAYLVFLVQHRVPLLGEEDEDRIQIYPIRRTSSGYVMTNDLADDRLFEFFYDLYRDRMQHLVTPEEAQANANSAE